MKDREACTVSSDHTRLWELFLAACDLPESLQDAMVEEQCGDDPELRRELLLLLRSDARTSGIFVDEKTTDGIQFQFDTVAESALPGHIGRYVKRISGPSRRAALDTRFRRCSGHRNRSRYANVANAGRSTGRDTALHEPRTSGRKCAGR